MKNMGLNLLKRGISIFLFIHLYTKQSICLSIYLSILFELQFVKNMGLNLLIRGLSIFLFIHLPTHQSIYLSIYLYNLNYSLVYKEYENEPIKKRYLYVSIYPSIYQPIYLSIYLSI